MTDIAARIGLAELELTATGAPPRVAAAAVRRCTRAAARQAQALPEARQVDATAAMLGEQLRKGRRWVDGVMADRPKR